MCRWKGTKFLSSEKTVINVCHQISVKVMVLIFVNYHCLGAERESAVLESSQFAHRELRLCNLVTKGKHVEQM